MCVNNQLLKMLEEFFEGISPDELSVNVRAQEEIDNLCAFLTEQVDQGGEEDDVDVLDEARGWLKNIWGLISRGEKCKNPSLSKSYYELQEHLELLIDEANSIQGEGESWKDEYLIGNEEDDFYDDSDVDFDEEPYGSDAEDDAC